MCFLLLTLSVNAQQINPYDKVPGIPIAHSPDTTGIYLGSPSIVVMSNGDYIASHDFFEDPDGSRRSELAGDSLVSRVMGQHVYLSKDKGRTWQFQAEVRYVHWAGLFVVDDIIYLLGINGIDYSLAITRSEDAGKTWENLSVLRKKNAHYFHGSTTPVVYYNGRVYKGYDYHLPDPGGKWVPDNYSFIISASMSDDLMDPASWTFSEAIKKPDFIEGRGWLETNAVLGRDGAIKGITRIASDDGLHAGYYSLDTDSTIDTKSIQQIGFIGSATKFNISWDSQTKKYWSLVNYPSSVVRKLKKSAGGMRSILALTYSDDLYKWDMQAIILATGDVYQHGFQYVDWKIEGKDIIFVSRTAYDDDSGGARNYHDSNYITFHRIKNYKRVKTPRRFRFLLR